MRIARFVLPFAALAAVCLAGASSAAVPRPTHLHGFLLTAGESYTATFHRTPSFAWSPVRGAARYELQLSTSATFRENGLLYDDANLPTPVAAPALTLPWITGSPHSLYARVRALFAGGLVSGWSAPFGFDIVAPDAPAPLSSYSGLLRWTSVDGADAYEVWLVDKQPVTTQIEVVRTNVLDERDFYGAAWPSVVRWRVRAMRVDVDGRLNGMPAAAYGPWSPIYRSENSMPSSGPITLTGSISDLFSDGSTTSSAHELMPGFVWTGDDTLSGVPAALFRVEIFTDQRCLNRVYTGPAVASPAYAPRVSGLDLPTQAGVNDYVDPGQPTIDVSADGQALTANEQLPPALPTVTLGGTPTSGSGSSAGVAAIVGSPLDLWDVNWPDSGYYWTVVGVAQRGKETYQDLELPQEVCAAGRVQRFGISSQPSVTTHQTPFASGLSAKGRLVSAAQTRKFYGEPLVAWTPALGASVYEIQWSKKEYPFAPQADPQTGADGVLTYSTSAVLPLQPGRWWYRVRGFDYNLPTGAQEMAWSQPTKLVVTAPRFRVTAVKRHHSHFKVVGG
jgi:hypothetical protein